jgi:hypothetical protein
MEVLELAKQAWRYLECYLLLRCVLTIKVWPLMPSATELSQINLGALVADLACETSHHSNNWWHDWNE